jgi:hypothetical protein
MKFGTRKDEIIPYAPKGASADDLYRYNKDMSDVLKKNFIRTREDLDQIKSIVDDEAWTAFVPSWTNLTVGSGTNTGYYKQIGKTVFLRLLLTFAADTSIGGAVLVALPVTAINYGAAVQIGQVLLYDTNVNLRYSGVIRSDSSIMVQKTDGTYAILEYLSSSVPFTWTTSDQIRITGCYEAA